MTHNNRYETFGQHVAAKNIENGMIFTEDTDQSSSYRPKTESRFISAVVSIGGLLLLLMTITIATLSYTNVEVEIIYATVVK